MAESVLGSKAYVGAIGSSHNALAFVTRVGADYGRAHNPLADLDLVPETYTGVAMQGMWAELNEQVRINDAHRAAQFGKLRAAGVLGADNITDPDRGLYQSDTGEIVTDVGRRTMTVDAPRFQAAALKPESGAARLSALAVESVSVPASVLAISLDADARRTLPLFGPYGPEVRAGLRSELRRFPRMRDSRPGFGGAARLRSRHLGVRMGYAVLRGRFEIKRRPIG